MKFFGGIGQLHLGTQHKHRQTLDGLRHQVAPAHQQNLFIGALVKHKARLHAAFGIAKRRQARLRGLHQQHIVGELVVQKVSSVSSRCAHHAQVG